MGRPRNKQHAKLPDYVYLTGGRYVYRKHLGGGKFAKDVRIAGRKASEAQVWIAYHGIVGIASGASLKDLFRLYRESPGYKKLAPKTRKEYESGHAKICALQVDGRLFGDIPYAAITTGAVQSMMDFLSATPVMANRLHSAMAGAFAWGKQRDKITSNPCLGVDRYAETARTEYVDEAEYEDKRGLARELGYIRIAIAMELAYLCRLREVEIVALKRSDARQDGVLAQRVKGSKTQIIGNTERLDAALRESKALSDPESIYIIPASDGGKLTAEGFRSDWQRFRAEAKELGRPIKWHFHDLKAAGVSDFEGDKHAASGHKTRQMTAIYDRKLETVRATK